MRPAGLVVVTSVIAVCSFLVTEGCGIFASGECSDLALCPDQASVEGGSVDVTSGTDGSKGGVDVQVDTLVASGERLAEHSQRRRYDPPTGELLDHHA